jgi:hypothetical protein
MRGLKARDKGTVLYQGQGRLPNHIPKHNNKDPHQAINQSSKVGTHRCLSMTQESIALSYANYISSMTSVQLLCKDWASIRIPPLSGHQTTTTRVLSRQTPLPPGTNHLCTIEFLRHSNVRCDNQDLQIPKDNIRLESKSRSQIVWNTSAAMLIVMDTNPIKTTLTWMDNLA